MRNNEQFVSFMVENDDSLLQQNNEDYFKSLSKEFYGSKSQDLRKQLKVIKSVGDLKLKLNKSDTNKGVLQPFSVSHQLQQQIHKLLSKPKLQVSSFQNSFKNNTKFSIQQVNRKLVFPKNEDSNFSYRSTLNTSTKSQPRTDRALDLYQMKLKTERSAEKVMIKRKQH